MVKSLKFKLLIILGLTIVNVSCFCDYDWIPYKEEKCIKVFDVISSYFEAEVFCDIGFDSTILELDSREEQAYLTVYLFRLFNLANNIWLKKKTSNTDLNNLTRINNVSNSHDCSVMLSVIGAQNVSQNVGKLESKPCDSLYGFVCQKVKQKTVETNNNLTSIPLENPYYINKPIKSNKTETSVITGLYYKFVNKEYNSFSLTHFANDICSSNVNNGECKQYFPDKGVTIEANSNSFIFIEHNGAYRIKEKNTLKDLGVYRKNVVRLYECTEIRQNLCDKSYELNSINYLWSVYRFNGTNYYQISDYPLNRYVLGLSHWEQNSVNTTSMGLYSFLENYESPKTHWRFEFESLTLSGELQDIELIDSIDTLIAKNTKQIDLIETISIINDSPANLDHEVSVEKSFTETFSVSFGESQRYLDSFTIRREQNDQFSKTISNTDSVSNTLGEICSKSISNSLAQAKSKSETESSSKSRSNSKSNTNSQTNSRSNTNSNSDSTTNENSFGVSLKAGGSFLGIGASITTNYGYKNSHTSEQSNSQTDENSNTKTIEQSESETNERSNSREHSNTDTLSHELTVNSQQNRDQTNQMSKENTNGETNGVSNGTELNKQTEITYDRRNEYSNSTTHTYKIDKTIQVPPFSAIKISSFINWVNDLKFSYNILLKFSATALRRKRIGINEWSTLDSDGVKLILEKTGFPGMVYHKTDDNVYVKVLSSFKGSFGIESYFVAKEIDRSFT